MLWSVIIYIGIGSFEKYFHVIEFVEYVSYVSLLWCVMIYIGIGNFEKDFYVIEFVEYVSYVSLTEICLRKCYTITLPALLLLCSSEKFRSHVRFELSGGLW